MPWSSAYRPGYCTHSCAAPDAPVYRESSTIEHPGFRRRLTTPQPVCNRGHRVKCYRVTLHSPVGLILLTPRSRLCSLPRCQNINPRVRPRLEKDTQVPSVPAKPQNRPVSTEKRSRPQGRRAQTAGQKARLTGSHLVRMRLTVTAVLSFPFPTTNSLRENKP